LLFGHSGEPSLDFVPLALDNGNKLT
jgi:hypothetical protein